MLYEKLHRIFNSSGCSDYFPDSLVNNLHRFMKSSLEQGKRLISPYKFADFSGITVKDAVTFFMFFTVESYPLKVVFFFECSRLACSNRIYLDNNDLQDIYSEVICDDCGKQYKVIEIREHIQAYFRIDNSIMLTDFNLRQPSGDPNSAFSAFKGMPESLKIESPSFSDEISNGNNEGDDKLSIVAIAESNRTKQGKVINEEADEFVRKVLEGYGV